MLPSVDLLKDIPFDYGMWGVLGITLIVFGVYSAILLWHWRVYSTGKFTTVGNMLLYIGVSLLFICIMVFSALAYTFL